MDFADLVRRRKMTRDYSPEPVAEDLLDHVLDQARRVPSAGNTQGFHFVVLTGTEETGRYWDVTFPADRRAGFRWQGLFRAPVIVTVWGDPDAYVARYAEADKARTGLGSGADAWATPYWVVDASFAAMTMQYAAIDAGLGVLFFGMFDHAAAVATAFGVPESMVPIGTLTIGWPAEAIGDEPAGRGRSATRPRRPLSEVVHRGGWAHRRNSEG